MYTPIDTYRTVEHWNIQLVATQGKLEGPCPARPRAASRGGGGRSLHKMKGYGTTLHSHDFVRVLTSARFGFTVGQG